MNKLNLAKLLAAVNIFYKKAQSSMGYSTQPNDKWTPEQIEMMKDKPLNPDDFLPSGFKAMKNLQNTPAAPAVTPTMSYRSDVFRAQQRLTKAPYSMEVSIDGLLGPQTKGALKTYMAQKGLPTMEAAIDALEGEAYEEAPTQLATPRDPNDVTTWGNS